MRRLMSFLIKAAVSVLLLYLSMRRVNLGSIGQQLGGLDLRWVTFIFFILCAQTSLLALRWRQIVLICGAKLRPATAMRYTLIGHFFSKVLPSTVVGDAARTRLLARVGDDWSTAVYTVLIES